MNLPAYLQNKTRVDLNTVATAGMGGAMPNHISIRGNQFTLIDESGNKMPLGPIMVASVVDMLEYMAKQYYEEDWKEGSDEPPTCWSMNGVGPSRESSKPQARTCSECEWNKRGSDTSKLSGASIKACRDEKPLALLLPQYPNMLFRLVITPGSFKNWQKFVKPFENSGMDVSDVLVQFAFEMQKNGVMTFDIAKDAQGNGVYMPEHLVPIFNKAIATKATDVLVGRNDVPIALPAPQPAAVTQVTLNNPGSGYTGSPALPGGGSFGGGQQAQVPFGASTAHPAPNAGAFGQTPQQPAQPAETKSPSEQQPRRTRRTQAQIAADNAAKAAQAGGAASPMSPASAPVQPSAPFPVQNQSAPGFGAAPAAPQGGFGGGQPAQVPFGTATSTFAAPAGASTPQTGPAPASNGFGIQPGADPNVDPQLAAMLATLGT